MIFIESSLNPHWLYWCPPIQQMYKLHTYNIGIARKLQTEAEEDSDPECIAGTFLRLEIPRILSGLPLQRHDRSYALYTDQDILWWRKVPGWCWPAYFLFSSEPKDLECGNGQCCSFICMIFILYPFKCCAWDLAHIQSQCRVSQICVLYLAYKHPWAMDNYGGYHSYYIYTVYIYIYIIYYLYIIYIIILYILLYWYFLSLSWRYLPYISIYKVCVRGCIPKKYFFLWYSSSILRTVPEMAIDISCN